MCLLTEQEIATVANDVENQGINFSHLSADLIDHVCCDIEERMDRGISFEQAYELVKEEFGIKGLRHIQKDTLMLIDKNYRIMKNSMKLIGVLSLALMAFGALFKIMHWPGSGLMLAVSFFFTTFVFFPSALYVMYKEVNRKKQVVIYIVAFACGVVFITSILFKVMQWPFANLLFIPGVAFIAYILIPLIIFMKIKKRVFLVGLISLMVFLTGMLIRAMHWPGGGIFLIAGSISLVLVFIPLFYVFEIRKSEKIRTDFLFGIIAITYFIVMSFFMALTPQMSLLVNFHFQSKSYEESASYLFENTNKVQNLTDTELALQLSEQANLVYNQLGDIKSLIIKTHVDKNKEAADTNDGPTKMLNEGGAEVNYLLLQYNANSPLPELKKELENFKALYNVILTDSLQENSFVNQLFNMSASRSNNIKKRQSWENYHFMQRPATAALSTLSQWQYNIRLAENRAMCALVNKLKSN